MMSLVWTIIFTVAISVNSQDCLRPADSRGRQIPFRESNRFAVLPSGTQAIITSYQFHCCGNITAWRTYVQPSGSNGVFTINFQVWRPSPTVNVDGCYSLVRENRFSSIEGGTVIETLAKSDIITVRPGDVVGYFFMSSGDGGNEGIQLDTTFNDEAVWYNGGTLMSNGGESCPFPVGPTRTLSASTSAAPVFSVDISSFSCPALPPHSITPSKSTSSLSSTTIPPLNTPSLSPSSARTPQPTPSPNTAGLPASAIVIGTASGGAVLVILLIILVVSTIICLTSRKDGHTERRNNVPFTANASNILAISQAHEQSLDIEDKIYDTIDDDIEMKNKIPLTTNESYGTASSRALGMESTMYDYIDTALKKDFTTNGTTFSQALGMGNKIYATVDDDAFKKSNVSLTVNPSYGTTSS